jgi:hypothetical protein
MQNCRFEDNYTDFGLLGKVNTPIYKCDPPATNAIWGMGAINPSSAVIEVGTGADGKSTGIAMASGPSAGAAVSAWGGWGMPKPPQMEQCKPGEIDTGLTCDTVAECKTEEDKSQPMKGPFGEIWGYMFKTTCTKPSSRPKNFY